jgi:transposase
MTQSYSLDLRVRVVAFVEAGHSCRAAARHFRVSDSFAIKLLQRQRQSVRQAAGPRRRRHGLGCCDLHGRSRWLHQCGADQRE